MKIIIQQCLHGYLNGHQMLGNSVELTPEARRTLLFQSDLSGPKTNSGYDSYLTGYPLPGSNYFVLARTWYASEMPRPGCVWTHSLLIEFADLGKIPELTLLIKSFKRPLINNYREYQYPAEFEDLSINIEETRGVEYDAIAKAVYSYPEFSIAAEAISSEIFERAILELWSDQWPRLRRNFLFCTGALSLKALGQRRFDFQVIPQKNSDSITRDAESYIFKLNKNDKKRPHWLETVHATPKNTLRRFLWSLGSDMTGERENYPKLVELFEIINKEKSDLSALNQILKGLFPQPEKAKAFKSSIFGSNRNYGQFTEIEILTFLLSEDDLNHLSYEDYAVVARLITFYKKQLISLDRYIELIDKAIKNRYDDTVFDAININTENAISVIKLYPSLIRKALLETPAIAYLKEIWLIETHLQNALLKELHILYPHHLPSEVLFNILASKSRVIYQVEEYYGDIIIEQSLNWYNLGSNELLVSWQSRIFYHYTSLFTDWLTKNIKSIHPKILIDTFQKNAIDWILRLSLPHQVWIESYGTLKTAGGVNLPYISSLFFSKGLTNAIYGSDWIVTMVFTDVYEYAKGSQISNHWGIIPKDYDDYDEANDSGPFDFILKAIGFNSSKKNKDIDSWDYCEILIRTVSTKYYKNNWSPQSYLDTFQENETFKRSLAYLLSKRRGTEYLNKVKANLFQLKKITGKKFQVELLSEINLK